MIIFSESTEPQEFISSCPQKCAAGGQVLHRSKADGKQKSKSGGVELNWKEGRGSREVLPPHRLQRMNTRRTCLLPVARRFIIFPFQSNSSSSRPLSRHTIDTRTPLDRLTDPSRLLKVALQRRRSRKPGRPRQCADVFRHVASQRRPQQH